MSVQNDIAYVFQSPEGVRAVLNDKADPDFVGIVDVEAGGVSGVEGAAVRTAIEEIVEGHGAILNPFYYGARSMTWAVIFTPDPSPTLNAKIDQLEMATDAMADDGTVSWAESGSFTVEAKFRRELPWRVTGARPKRTLLGLVSGLWYVRSAAEHSVAVGAGSTAVVAAAGKSGYLPRVVVNGPRTNPVIRNDTTGEELRLNITLAAGQTLDVDFDKHTVFQGATNRYSAVDPTSTWWSLRRGNNVVRNGGAAGTGAMTLFWRDIR